MRKSILEITYSLVLLMPYMFIISYDEKDYYCGGLKFGLWKIKLEKSLLFVAVTMYLVHHHFSLLVSYLWDFLGFEPIFIYHCWIIRSKLSIIIVSDMRGSKIFFKKSLRKHLLKATWGEKMELRAHAHECIYMITPHTVTLILWQQEGPRRTHLPLTHTVEEY